MKFAKPLIDQVWNSAKVQDIERFIVHHCLNLQSLLNGIEYWESSQISRSHLTSPYLIEEEKSLFMSNSQQILFLNCVNVSDKLIVFDFLSHDQACKFVCLWRLLSVCLWSKLIRATVCYRPVHWMIFARNLISFHWDRENGDRWEQVILPSCSSFSCHDQKTCKDVSDGHDWNGKWRETLKIKRR
jgi:hypothetical protein